MSSDVVSISSIVIALVAVVSSIYSSIKMRQTLAVQIDALRATTRPRMIARLTSPSIEHPEIIGLEIMNAGSTSAIDINVAFSPDLPKVRVSDLKHPFGDYKMVNLPSQALRHVEDQVIAEWPPGLSTTYTYWVGVDPDIHAYAIDGLSPKTKVTFSYSDEARKVDYVGTFLLDPSIYSAAKHRIAETFKGADSATPKVEEI